MISGTLNVWNSRVLTDELALCRAVCLNALDSRGNCSATANNTMLIHWSLMDGVLHMVQRGGDWAGCGPAQAPPHCTKCNSPPVNGQFTNHCMMVHVALRFQRGD